jgi:putative phosphoesterase
MELPTDRVRARRIGLVADTHSAKSDGSDLPQAVLDALRDAELIVHLGDMGATGSLDRFATIAPVIATRGGHAVGSDPRIASEARIIEAGKISIGALFDLCALAPEVTIVGRKLELGGAPLAPILQRIFGRAVDVVAFAATHLSLVAEHEGVLFVNPGSPNLPAEDKGTIAMLLLEGSAPRAEIREV